MTLGFGGQLSAFLAEQAGTPKHISNIHITNEIYYGHAFLNNAILALIVGLILLALSPWLNETINEKLTQP